MGEWAQLQTEIRNAASTELDLMPTLDILQLMNGQDATVAQAVGQVINAIAKAVDYTVAAIRAGGRLIYVGAGTSGRLGILDASECPPTFGVGPETVLAVIAGGPEAVFRAIEEAEDQPESAAMDLRQRNINVKDMVIGISASGVTPYVWGALQEAKSSGARTAIVICNNNQEVSAVADVVISPMVGPEVLTGSTRLKAGTAQKMVLNMISTATMVRLGRVYQNLMVDMRPTNKKLQDRAARIVQLAVGCGNDQAKAALLAAGNEIKTAIVMWKLACGPEEARQALARAEGFIRKAVDSAG